MQGMTGQEFRCAQAAAAFALKDLNLQRSAAATDYDAGFVRLQNLPWRPGNLDDTDLPDFEQMRLRLSRQVSEGPRPRHEPPDAIPNRCRRLVPINLTIRFFYLRGVTDPFGRLS